MQRAQLIYISAQLIYIFHSTHTQVLAGFRACTPLLSIRMLNETQSNRDPSF